MSSSLILNEEQELLRRMAREFVAEHAPVKRVRELRDHKDAVGFSRQLWKDMAELGWAGIVFPEAFGGLGLGYAELGLVLEECGRKLVQGPFLSTLLAGNVLLLCGSEAQKKEHLPRLISGEGVLALAFQEGSRYRPPFLETRAERTERGFSLTGEKVYVLDGHVADRLIVLASTGDGFTFFLVDPSAKGVTLTRSLLIDGRNAARLRLEHVEVDRGAVVGEVGKAAPVLDTVVDRATIALCAEMLGGIQESFETTIAYLKERQQFGVPIGSFQALKHRAASLFCEVELCKSIVLTALRAVDAEEVPGGSSDVAKLASIAKARCSDVFVQVGNESIQMHGGIGMTDECDVGFYVKRARVAEMTFGDAAYHRDRYARLEGY
jgi:alkylation response protein AidB-like acyl-CoA dehydrogenase